MKKNNLVLSAIIILAIAVIGHLLVNVKPENTTATIHIEILSTPPKTGEISIELFDSQAPITVKNFLSYVEDGFYNDTIFHRVIENFMVQGGGFTEDLVQKTPKAPITNEATNKIGNTPGTIAMARTSQPHSATSQFFINFRDNHYLNHRNTTNTGYGYAVFGKVIPTPESTELLDYIEKTKTKQVLPHQNVPIEPIVIRKITIKKGFFKI